MSRKASIVQSGLRSPLYVNQHAQLVSTGKEGMKKIASFLAKIDDAIGDLQKIVDANEKLVKELKDAKD